ncbi:MAG: efflux RND transporter periplasmic adaptor subunit [Alphaproteobacteria bacterium]|nr:efflux RND transporter periplasmic adaptor subunit [Alphaproteobacteria bacterium]
MRKLVLPAILVIAVIGAAGAWGWREHGPVTVDLVQPTRGPAIEAVYATGTVEASVMLPIAPKIGGRIEALLVDERADVREGQPLARLENRELAASVREWEARVRYGEQQFRRADELFRSRTGTAAALDQARNELETARATLDRARRQLAETTLVAPAAGRIIRRDGEIGQLIEAGHKLFWISCCDTLRVAAEIDEEDIPLVRPGQKVLIRSDAFPGRVLEGTVSEITPKGDPVARSFRVRIALPADTPLMIGMTADTNVIVQQKPDTLLIPTAAIVDGKVWLVREERLVARPVEIGIRGNAMTEIRAGIADGDRIVATPPAGLREGRSVRTRARRG